MRTIAKDRGPWPHRKSNESNVVWLQPKHYYALGSLVELWLLYRHTYFTSPVHVSIYSLKNNNLREILGL